MSRDNEVHWRATARYLGRNSLQRRFARLSTSRRVSLYRGVFPVPFELTDEIRGMLYGSVFESLLSRELVESRPDDVQKIVDAWFMTLEWIDANPDEAVAIMSERAGVTPDPVTGARSTPRSLPKGISLTRSNCFIPR